MKNLFRLVFISLAIFCLVQFPLFSWAKDTVKLKPLNKTTKIKGVTKSAKPDVVVSLINFSPGSPKVNEEITLWVFVKNLGQARADAFDLRVKVGGESNPPVVQVPGLNPQQRWRYTKKLFFGRTGNFIVTATADPGNQLAESREENNVLQKTIMVRKGPKPDLVISKINYSPASPRQHKQVTVWYFVKNIGQGIAEKCYLSTTNSLNNHSIWHKKLVPALDPGREWRYEGMFTSNQAGTYYLKAVIDRGNKIDETDEENNIKDKKIIVKPPSN